MKINREFVALKEEAKMKLEVGKKYVSRGGEVVEIVAFHENATYPYRGTVGKSYLENGRFDVAGPSHDDLIREHEEPKKMKPHVHAELIKAWADGAEIEYLDESYNEWAETETPIWDHESKYRLKPQPKPDVVRSIEVVLCGDGVLLRSGGLIEPNIRMTYDGETGKLKDAEVIK